MSRLSGAGHSGRFSGDVSADGTCDGAMCQSSMSVVSTAVSSRIYPSRRVCFAGGMLLGKGLAMKRLGWLLAVVVLLSGCGGPVEAGKGDDGTLDNMRSGYAQYVDSVPINASYRKQIAGALDHDSSGKDVIEQVLADGIIDPGEMNDVERQMVGCFSDRGYEVNVDYWLAKDGGFAASNAATMPASDERVQDAIRQCESSTGYGILVYYYNQASRNPDDIDLDPYVFQCFREHGLVDAGLAYDEFRRIGEQGGNPLVGDPARSDSSKHQDWEMCVSDPLHNVADSPLAR